MTQKQREIPWYCYHYTWKWRIAVILLKVGLHWKKGIFWFMKESLVLVFFISPAVATSPHRIHGRVRCCAGEKEMSGAVTWHGASIMPQPPRRNLAWLPHQGLQGFPLQPPSRAGRNRMLCLLLKGCSPLECVGISQLSGAFSIFTHELSKIVSFNNCDACSIVPIVIVNNI